MPHWIYTLTGHAIEPTKGLEASASCLLSLMSKVMTLTIAQLPPVSRPQPVLCPRTIPEALTLLANAPGRLGHSLMVIVTIYWPTMIRPRTWSRAISKDVWTLAVNVSMSYGDSATTPDPMALVLIVFDPQTGNFSVNGFSRCLSVILDSRLVNTAQHSLALSQTTLLGWFTRP